ncbi:Argininosuccinate lyase [Delftia tsuruhatensis]|uniref:Bug family tripartite tricarboxylate transporter substrate binding protein n=1 Tax=Delftia tsuruhatensis TaxID=180282 RepID=UPI001E7208A9|nr:tripartite tricarboxylate transporter substrate-binding protein [Delftia tsuruhatensis]CAB5706534.1 Argininosuccinate lyase [Delftia tsuruhatensis]CAC9675440.1 Argininosuccinate lyase [Delftia tsuruhatensis]
MTTNTLGRHRRWARARMAAPLLALLLCTAGGLTTAHAWPTKPVRLVVSFAPGGLADVMVRLLQPQLAEALGQPVLIDNRSGASGNVAGDLVARSGDGHSFLVAASSVESVNPSMFSRMPFDPAKDLVHVALLANTRLFLVARPDLPSGDLSAFIHHARSHPGMSYGSPGTGSTPHLAGEMLRQAAGVAATHVPYRGAQPALQAVLSGQIDYAFVPGTALTWVRGGKLRLLAVASAARVPEAPDTPAFAEQGLGDVAVDTLFGVYGPAGTPPPVVERLNGEINRLLAQPSIKARFAELGAEPLPVTPAAFKATVQAETLRFAAVVKAANIKAD